MSRNAALMWGIIGAALIFAVVAWGIVFATVIEPRAEHARAVADARFNAQEHFAKCKAGVETTYASNWAASCVDRQSPFAGKADPECSLPLNVSNVLNQTRQQGLDECMREAKAGF